MATPVSNSVPLLTGGNNNNGTLTEEFISGLVQGSSWTFNGGPRVLTYALTLNDYIAVDEPGGPQPGPGDTWAENPGLATAFSQAFAAWSNVANVTFQLIGVADSQYYYQTSADIAIALTGDQLTTLAGAVALGVFPDPVLFPGDDEYPNIAGDIVLDNDVSFFPDVVLPGSSGFQIILHEIGHALGLKHTDDDGGNGRPSFATLGINSYDSDDYTVMGSGVPPGTRYAATPMPLDILAIQHIYGANMSYHAGNDVYTLSDDGAARTIWDGGGTDTIDASAINNGAGITLDLRPGQLSSYGNFQGKTAISFGVTIENAVGTGYTDTIFGNDADNILDAGAGPSAYAFADTLSGGLGNDVYIIYSTQTIIVEGMGQGLDQVSSSVTFALPSNIENLTLTGAALNGTGNDLDNILAGDASSNALDGGAGNDTLLGNSGNDVLMGGIGNDVLDGGVGLDTLRGGAGDDIYVIGSNGGAQLGPTSLSLVGEPGNQVLNGQSLAFDLTTGTFSTQLFDINADGRVDHLSVRYQSPDHSWTVSFGAVGSAPQPGVLINLDPGTYIDAEANAQANRPRFDIVGDGHGLNSIADFTIFNSDLAPGADTVFQFYASFSVHAIDSPALLQGVLIINNADQLDSVIEQLNDGIDTAQSSISYTLPLNIENLILTGNGNVDGTGNALANLMTGSSGNNTLIGNDGNDTLLGGDGIDTMDGGLGNDSVMGGDGDDTVIVATSDGDDVLSGGNGFDTLDFSAVGGVINIDQLGGLVYGSTGNDTLLDIFSYVIGTSFNDVLSGGNQGDVLDGNDGDDMFFGNKGDDLLRGGDGNDTFYFSVLDGDDRLLGGNGFDVLDYSGLGGVVQVNQFAGTTNGTAGNDILLDLFEMVIGTSFGDVLSGGNGPNTLKGGPGDDQIFANGGDDYVNGGPGSDTTTFGPGNDTLDFWAGDQLETITDFQAGAGSDDTITLTHYSGIPRTLAGLQGDNRITQVGADTHIALNGGDEIILQNVTASALHQDDFVF